jgi:hypothetical protein
MSLFYNQTAYVLRPTIRTNRANEAEVDYTGLEDQPGVPWAPVHVRTIQQGLDVEDDRRVSAQSWMIASEPGSGDVDLQTTDWLRLPSGEIVAVEGAIARPSDPFGGGLHHVEVRVQLAKG